MDAIETVRNGQRIRFEIVDGDIYNGDPVGDAIGEGCYALGVFGSDNGFVWRLKEVLTADQLAKAIEEWNEGI